MLQDLHRELVRVWNAVDRTDELLAICIAFEAAHVDKLLHRSAGMHYSALPALRGPLSPQRESRSTTSPQMGSTDSRTLFLS